MCKESCNSILTVLNLDSFISLIQKKMGKCPVDLYPSLALREQSNVFSYLLSKSHLNSKQVTVTCQISSQLPILSSIRNRGGEDVHHVSTTCASKSHCWKIQKNECRMTLSLISTF